MKKKEISLIKVDSLAPGKQTTQPLEGNKSPFSQVLQGKQEIEPNQFVFVQEFADKIKSQKNTYLELTTQKMDMENSL